MSDESTAKRTPDYLAYTVKSVSGQKPRYTRIGVGFNHKGGGIGIMYDAIPLTGQIILIGMEADKPATVSYSAPTRPADFNACMVRQSGDNSYWTEVGAAYHQEGYISILLDAVPTGKLVLTVPKERE